MNLELIIEDICEEMKLIKNKMNISNINKNNDFEDKIKDLIDLHNKDIKSLKKENEELKNEILKSQNENLKEEINKIKIIINSINKLPENNISQLSVILEEKAFIFIKEAIEKTMKKTIKEFKKLYQATIDGGDSPSFHKKCDNNYNTLTVF